MFLRAKKSMIEVQVADEDEQIGVLQEVLDKHEVMDHITTNDDESEVPPSSSLSLNSDDIPMNLPTSDDHVWTTAKFTTHTNSPSI